MIRRAWAEESVAMDWGLWGPKAPWRARSPLARSLRGPGRLL